MRLSDISIGQILRDGQFDAVTKIYDEMPNNALVFLNKPMTIPPEVSCIITKDFIPQDFKGGIVLFSDPKFLFYLYHSQMENESVPNQIGQANIMDAAVYDHNISIGDGSVILPFTTIFDGVDIGQNVIIGSSCSIGGQGFEVIQYADQNLVIMHRGQVVIKDNVIIQAHCCIDKGLFPNRPTILGEYVCLADLVHIAHGVKIGKRTRIAAGACINGNVTIGENVWIGPNCTITNGIEIGDNAFIGIGSNVLKSVEAGTKVVGNPARKLGE